MGVPHFYKFATFITYAVLNIIIITLNHKDTSSSTAADYRCRLCGKHFDTFGDMQRHELIKHVQEGDIDNQLEK
jgi:hypothetical protein